MKMMKRLNHNRSYLLFLLLLLLFSFPLKRESRSNVFEFLGDFRRRPVQIIGDAFLFGQLQGIILLAEIPVDDVFNGEIVRSVRKMISTTNRRMISAQMHLQMLEEVVVFVRRERHEHADAAAEGGVDERLGSAGNERGFLQR